MKKLLIYLALPLAIALIVRSSLTAPKPATGRLIFPHKFHVEEVGVACEVCHKGIEASTDGKQRFIPGMDVCAQCHEEDVNSDKGCVKCHSDPKNIIPAPAAGVNYAAFSHKLHAAKVECKTCHAVEAGVAEKGQPFPKMKNCADCHAKNTVNPACDECHQNGLPAAPMSHKVNWKTGHGLEARFDADDCAMCHTAPGAKTNCNTCHQGAEFGSPHPRNFVHSTAFIREGSLANCQTCHEPESFCATCHQQRNVLPSDHSRSGWATAKPTNGGLHARKGAADIDRCVICHASLTQQPTCFSAGCHQ